MNDNKLNGLRYADSTLNSSTSRIKFGVGAHEQFIDERLTTEMVADVKIRNDTNTGLVIFDLLNEKNEIIATRYLDNYALTRVEYDATNKRLVFIYGQEKIIYCDLSELVDAVFDHIADQTNPHNVTKAQVGLSQVENKPLDSQVIEDSDNYITSGAVKTYVDVYGGKIDAITLAGEPVDIVNKIVNLPTYSLKLSDDGVLELETIY